ncbi:MAG: hypothetical protein ACOC1F_07695, partial [Myxococcota bacterium]
MTGKLTFIRAATLGATLAVCPLVAAQPSISDKATARSLFEEGRALVAEGKVEQACPKFKGSYDLDPGAGSAFHLADCYEKTGKVASAWVLFLEVAVLMRDAGEKEKEAAARKRAEALAPRLSRLNIQVPKEHVIDGLTVVRDGEKVNAASWNTALPVDPGEHTVTVSAPGREAWTTVVTIDGEGVSEKIVVPQLPASQKEPPPSTTPATPSTASTDAAMDSGGLEGQRMTGLIVGGGGVLVFGVGTFLGLRAKSSYDDSEAFCNGDVCTQQGLDIRSDARSDANMATIVGGLGLAAMVGGAVMYFTAPDEVPETATGTTVGVGPGSIMVRGA